MRFFEFKNDSKENDLVTILRNFIGRSTSKKTPAKLNWSALNQIAKSTGFELAADYETFKKIYDSNPAIRNLVKNFNDRGIELNVPGTTKEPEAGSGKEPEDSQAAVDKMAASAAPQQLAQTQQTPQI